MGWQKIFDWLIYSNLIEAQAAAGLLTTGKMPTCSTSSQAKPTAPTVDGSEGKQMYCKICLKFDQRSKMSPIAKLTWKDINVAHGNRCTAFLQLVDLLLSIPASSADAERGFSQLRLVKKIGGVS